MEPRFIRNIPAVSEEQQNLLRSRRALIVGCGGLGGYIAEMLARCGLGGLSLADGDVFEETNLNRQLLALPSNLGQNKAREAARRIRAIDGDIELRVFGEYLSEENADRLLEGVHVVLDGLDSAADRLLLERKCAGKGLWLVHGAVEGWTAQVCAVAPGSGLLSRLYGAGERGGSPGVIAPTAALCAAMQCAEALKILLGEAEDKSGPLLTADLRSMEFFGMEFT